MKDEVSIRITLSGPPAGVAYALQRGKDEIVSKVRSDGSDISFLVRLAVSGRMESGAPRFTGPFAQGPPGERFVYVTIGTSAGDPGSPWTRRAKIHLSGITWEMFEQVLASPGAVITAKFPGTDRKGEPACASIKALEDWNVSQR